MNRCLRFINPQEYALLEDFLYEAIYVAPGQNPPPRSIVYTPSVYPYIKEFGRKGDICVVCEIAEVIVGAAWTRILDRDGEKGYGNIGPGIPELTIAVSPPFRSQGIGTELIRSLHRALQAEGYTRISLSVQKGNPAFRFYERNGYRIWKERTEDFIMVWEPAVHLDSEC